MDRILVNTRKIEVILRYAKKNKSPHGMPRQEVAFLEKCRKIKGCGSLEEDFYTRFIPIFKDFGL